MKVAALFLLMAGLLMADDWSQFRGPNGSGISSTTGLPLEFGPNKNVLWKTPLPRGHSSPVLGRETIFVTAFEEERLVTVSLNRRTGAVHWARELPRNRKDRLQKPNNPASPSPVTDGENVFVFFQDFGLIAYDADGGEKWRVPLGPFNSFYGMGASPILVGNKLIMACDQDTESFMIAVDKETGKLLWRVERPEAISGYSTPVVFKPRNAPPQILVPESFQLSAYSSETGERIWWVRGLACEMKSIPSLDRDTLYINGWGFPQNQPGMQIKVPPLSEALARDDKDGDGKISAAETRENLLKRFFEAFDSNRDGFLDPREWEIYRAMMAAENGLLAIRLGGRGDMTPRSIRWRYQKPVPQVPSTLLYRDVLYMVNDSGILLSFDPETGEVHKQGRLHGAVDKYFASPVAADGKVYLVGQGGTVSVIRAGAEWELLAVNELDDEVFATPAIADGKIYIRTQSALYCFASAD